MSNNHITPVETENLAQTLSRVLPQATVLRDDTVNQLAEQDVISQIALPDGFTLTELDREKLLPHPRRTVATAKLSDSDSFIAYVARHNQARSVVWCDFNPQTYSLAFKAVIDEHSASAAGWRSHVAHFAPEMSAEWKTWTAQNGSNKTKSQMEFAEFIERHELDIASQEGYPTSLDMLRMATEFEANSDKRIKSVVRLHGGGVRMDYTDDDNAETLAQMKVFEKFQIGIPVFWAGPGYRIDARLKYRHGKGQIIFWYELIRADRVHEAAAKELIEKVRAGIGATPLLMGSCS